MVLQAVLPSVDDLPAELKEHYTPGEGTHEGKFVLGVTPEGDFELVDTSALKRALQTERSKASTLETSFHPFKDLDATKVREALKRVKELNAKGDPTEEFEKKFKSREDQLVSAHREELGTSKKANKKLLDKIEEVLIVSTAIKAITDAHGDAALLLPHVRSHMKLGDDFNVDIVDPSTKQALIGDSQGGKMSLNDLIEKKMKKEFPGAFEADTASGTGATGSAGGAKGAAEGTGTGGNDSVTQVEVGADGVVPEGASLEDIAAGKTSVNF